MKVAYEMYVNHVWKGTYDYDDEASVYDVLKHGTLVIGVLGWAETLCALFGKHHGESKEAEEFLMKMEKKLNAYAAECTERNKLNFAAYHTPAENLCYTAMTKLQQRWGKELKNVTDHEYVTNSIHVPKRLSSLNLPLEVISFMQSLIQLLSTILTRWSKSLTSLWTTTSHTLLLTSLSMSALYADTPAKSLLVDAPNVERQTKQSIDFAA